MTTTITYDALCEIASASEDPIDLTRLCGAVGQMTVPQMNGLYALIRCYADREEGDKPYEELPYHHRQLKQSIQFDVARFPLPLQRLVAVYARSCVAGAYDEEDDPSKA